MVTLIRATMSNLTILRRYATKNPADLPPSVLFGHTSRTMTIYDGFPKSTFHFLVLPRFPQPSDADVPLADLSSLRTLLRKDKARAKDIILAMKEDALSVQKDIETEMIRLNGFKWDVWTGFHGAPSMEHLHLHVLSADLCSEKLKNKKHYNSFHPKLGFFLDIDEVISWFDAEDSYFSTMAKLDHKQYEALLKGPLACFHCGEEQKNMPKLKTHLQEEFDTMSAREQSRLERKRKLEDRQAASEESKSKRQKSEPDEDSPT